MFLGCGGDTVCHDAVRVMVDECGLADGASLGGPVRECVDELECRAECVVEADCNDITSDEPDNDLAQCLAECAAKDWS